MFVLLLCIYIQHITGAFLLKGWTEGGAGTVEPYRWPVRLLLHYIRVAILN